MLVEVICLVVPLERLAVVMERMLLPLVVLLPIICDVIELPPNPTRLTALTEAETQSKSEQPYE